MSHTINRAPVVADEHGVVLAEVVEQREQIVSEVADAVGLDLSWRRRVPVPALIRREHVIPGVGERCHLMAPRVTQLGEAVAQHDGGVRRIAGLVHAQRDAVDRDVADGAVGHVERLSVIACISPQVRPSLVHKVLNASSAASLKPSRLRKL